MKEVILHPGTEQIDISVYTAPVTVRNSELQDSPPAVGSRSGRICLALKATFLSLDASLQWRRGMFLNLPGMRWARRFSSREAALKLRKQTDRIPGTRIFRTLKNISRKLEIVKPMNGLILSMRLHGPRALR